MVEWRASSIVQIHTIYILGKKRMDFFFDTGILASHEFQYYPISASIVQIQVDTRIKII